MAFIMRGRNCSYYVRFGPDRMQPSARCYSISKRLRVLEGWQIAADNLLDRVNYIQTMVALCRLSIFINMLSFRQEEGCANPVSKWNDHLNAELMGS